MSDSLPENYGQGDSGVEGNTVADSTAVESNDSSESSVNPYWASALEGIPKEFHGQLTPTFKEWDDNYAKDKESLAAYKQYAPFLEHKVPAADIEQAMQLAQIYQQQPRDLFNYLQTQYNFTNEVAEEEKEPETFDLAQDGYNLEKDPRFMQQQQETAMLRQHIEGQERQRIESTMRSQIDSEVSAVKQKYPMLDISDVASMATGLAGPRNELPNLMAAADHMAKYLPKDRASDGAPPTLSGNRGIPSNTPNFGKMSSEERSAYIADHMRAANQQ